MGDRLAPRLLRVGDVVETVEQAAALPVGTVVVQSMERRPAQATAVKVADSSWLHYRASMGEAVISNDDVVTWPSVRVVCLPRRHWLHGGLSVRARARRAADAAATVLSLPRWLWLAWREHWRPTDPWKGNRR